MQARQAGDKKIFDGLRRRYKRQAAENEANLMARIWETERAHVVKLSERWVENVANVRAPSGAQGIGSCKARTPPWTICRKGGERCGACREP